MLSTWPRCFSPLLPPELFQLSLFVAACSFGRNHTGACLRCPLRDDDQEPEADMTLKIAMDSSCKQAKFRTLRTCEKMKQVSS